MRKSQFPLMTMIKPPVSQDNSPMKTILSSIIALLAATPLVGLAQVHPSVGRITVGYIKHKGVQSAFGTALFSESRAVATPLYFRFMNGGGGLPSGIISATSGDARLTVRGSILYIPLETSASIYDLSGRAVVGHAKGEVKLLPGMYIVRLSDGKAAKVRILGK